MFNFLRILKQLVNIHTFNISSNDTLKLYPKSKINILEKS